jgi:eukaryotic-like serine/threonine-protein kinase
MTSSSDRADAELQGLPVSSDPENLRAREPLEVLISRFSEEVRRGNKPSIENYARQYREWADQIRELFPLIETLEHWKADKEMECLRKGLPQEFPIRQLGNFRLLQELGRGGMGIVFEALDETSGAHRAIKLLPWRYATGMEQWKEQFQREARTIAGLRHPNIVRVYAFGTHEGYCYYVMDLVRGVGLDHLIARLRETSNLIYTDEIDRAGRGNLTGTKPHKPAGRAARGLRNDSWNDFAHIALMVSQALDHAHEAGVLHNDIKPANLLLEGAGEVIVTDFGIGRRVAANGDDENEVVEQQIGTLRYMSPERLAGRRDIRSDVYALGATLYELATQTPAFSAEDRRQLVELIAQARFTPPRRLVPSLPRGLETIILNAMQPDPRDRYPSAAAMSSDLVRFVSGQSIVDRSPSLLGRVLRWFSRQR